MIQSPLKAGKHKAKEVATIALSALNIYNIHYTNIWLKRNQHKSNLTEWNKQHNALFIHIPKAAGISVKRSLGMEEDIWPHCPAAAYQKGYPDFFNNAYTFSFVRNPWDKLVSAFHFVKFRETPYNAIVAAEDLHNTQSFEDFLAKLRHFRFRHKMLTRMHFMPQLDFLSNDGRTIIVDKVGRFENLNEDFAEIANRLSKDASLKSANRGRDRTAEYRNYYKQDWQIELVQKMYEKDCQEFGYSF